MRFNLHSIIVTSFVITWLMLNWDAVSEESNSDAVSSSDLTVTVNNISEMSGAVNVVLYKGEKAYKKRDELTFNRIKVSSSSLQTTFEGLERGDYAIIVLHDENGNGKVDMNALFRPTEPIAFSNNARTGLRMPSYKKVRFDVSSDAATHTISFR